MIASRYLTVFRPPLPSRKIRNMPSAAIELGKLPEWIEAGKHLIRARKQKGLTQKGLADLCQLRQGEISAFESGRRHPTLAQLTELARCLDVPLQWFITGSLEPAANPADWKCELRYWGLYDLAVEGLRVPGAFRPLEQLLTVVLKGDLVPKNIVESMPYLLATNRWRSRLLLAYAREAGDARVLGRLGWLADVTRSLHKAGQLVEAQAQAAPLLTITKKATKSEKSDSLGHPAADWSTVPVVNMRWNITYTASADQFKLRVEQLRKLRPVREE